MKVYGTVSGAVLKARVREVIDGFWDSWLALDTDNIFANLKCPLFKLYV